GNVFDTQRDVVEVEPGGLGSGPVFEVEGAVGELHVMDGAGPEVCAVEKQGDGIGDGTQQRRDAAGRVRCRFHRLGRYGDVGGIVPAAKQKKPAPVGGHATDFRL